MSAKVPNNDMNINHDYENDNHCMGLNPATMTQPETDNNGIIQKPRTPIQRTVIDEPSNNHDGYFNKNLDTSLKKVYSVLVVFGILLLISIVFGAIGVSQEAEGKANTNESKTVSVDLAPNPTDCFEIKKLGHVTSGRYNIYPSSIGIANIPVEVWCDMDTAEGGWSVIQRREDGLVNFNRTFRDYQRGFGYAGGEFWIGNDNLHRITNQKSYKFRVEVELWNGTEIIKEFIHFRIGDEVSKYQLILESGISQDYTRPLGMDDGRIPDRDITASSIHTSSHAAIFARLNRPASGNTYGSWVPQTQNMNQWIQVRFGSLHVIGGVITQGRQDIDQWVTEFKVQYSDDGNSLTYVRNSKSQNDQIAVFTGNTDRNTHVTNLFDAPVRAFFIRILPTGWHDYIGLRFEVLGCKVYKEWTDLNHQPFSTGDNDIRGSHCAAVGGAWWYSDKCVQTGLNGKYLNGPGLDKGITWEDIGITYQVKRTEMKIRPAGY